MNNNANKTPAASAQKQDRRPETAAAARPVTPSPIRPKTSTSTVNRLDASKSPQPRQAGAQTARGTHKQASQLTARSGKSQTRSTGGAKSTHHGHQESTSSAIDPGLDRHTSLPYLWYSGSITEEHFMRTSLHHLTEFNELFTLDEKEETKLINPRARIPFSLSDLQTLGQALLKAFKEPLSDKAADRAKQAHLRHLVSAQLAQSCMNKLWEENFVANALQNKLALKTEQLRVAEEKSQIQSNLVAVSKRRQNMAEKELVRLTERNLFLSKETEDYATTLKDQLAIRDEILTELKSNFLEEFKKTVTDLTKQLTQNQAGQLTSTVQVQKQASSSQKLQNVSITISGQELFYGKMKQTFESMVRKAQSDQLNNIQSMLLSTDMVLRPELEKQKQIIEEKIAPFKRMSTHLGSRQQQDDFVNLMETQLTTIVKSQDCEKGIKLLIETLKKFHVGNFAMQQQLMSATNKKTEIELWKQSLVAQVRRSQQQLVDQNMQIITEMKQVQRQFNEFSQTLNYSKKNNASATINTSQNNSSLQHSTSNMSAGVSGKQQVMEITQRVETIWIKAERVNTEMIRTFSQLIGK